MINSIHIKNFRSFNEIKIDDCRRINIIVGDNGSGKTALLEALFLAAGVSPELALRTRSWRGFDSGRMTGSYEDMHRALWADLFHKFETNQSALVSLRGTGEQTRSVTVTLRRPGYVRLVPPSRKKSGAPVGLVRDPSPIEFKWKIRGLPVVTVVPTIEENKLVFPPVPESSVKASFFASSLVAPSYEAVNRFSLLSRTFADKQFIREFNHLYGHITNLSVEVTAGSPMLFAEVDGLPEKIPLGLASGGMSKLAAILLAMPAQTGGIILVDEIENGFYYKRLPFVWKSLLDFARGNECQIFASSHSAECLDAAAALAEENPKEFSVIRTVRENGETKVRQFGGDQFVDAMAENIEVR